MIICIQEVYEDETPQVYLIDTSLSKTKQLKLITNFLSNIDDSVSVPSDDVLIGLSGVLSQLTVEAPCYIDKVLTLYEDSKIDLKQWLRSLEPISENEKFLDMTKVFISHKAELPDGSPMMTGIGGKHVYKAIALRDIKDTLKKIILIKKGEICQVCFLGYTHPDRIGLFDNSYSTGSTPRFRIGTSNSENVFQDYVWTKEPPVFGMDFALPHQTTSKKNKP